MFFIEGIHTCLGIIDWNFSFNIANCDAEKYASMFPDSAIAKSLKQKVNKVR